jgi:hypothetical protein
VDPDLPNEWEDPGDADRCWHESVGRATIAQVDDVPDPAHVQANSARMAVSAKMGYGDV